MIDVVSLAQRLIQFPSVTPAGPEIFQFLDDLLTSLGFTVRRPVFHDVSSHHVENLYAYRPGSVGAAHLGFIGHVDVVAPGPEHLWHYPAFSGTIADERLYGRGAADMKGAIAAFITAAAQTTMPLSLLLTGDEEGPAVNGIAKLLPWILAHGMMADAFLVGEPTSTTCLGDTVKIGRRGSLNTTVISHGQQGHVAYPHLAMNPIDPLIDFLHALQHHTLDDGTSEFDPSQLIITTIDVNNPTTNMIPASTTAHFNIRFNTHHTGESLMSWVMAQAAAFGIDAHCTLSAEPFLSQPHALHDIVISAITRVTHVTPQKSTSGGTSDARFAQVYRPVIEFGLVNHTIHQVNENTPLQDLHNLQAVYHHVMADFSAFYEKASC